MKKFNVLVTVPQGNVASLIGLLTGVPGVKITVSSAGGSDVVTPPTRIDRDEPEDEDEQPAIQPRGVYKKGPLAILTEHISAMGDDDTITPADVRVLMAENGMPDSNASPTLVRLLKAGLIERVSPAVYRKA